MSWIDRELERFPPLRAETDGGALSYRRAGEGTPVVALHGIGSGSGSWLYQLSRLGDRCLVLAWDAPGYGESEPLAPERPSAADYAGRLAAWVDHVGLDSFHLLGHSLGALIAAAFAARHGTRVRGLVLAAPAPGYGDAPPAEREAGVARRVAGMEEMGPSGLAEARGPALLSANPPPEALEVVRWNMTRLRPEGYRQAAHMLAGGRLAVDLRRYDGRVLVLCGTGDTVTPPAGARAICTAAPDGRYAEIPRAGHACHIERPAAFNAAVAAFTGGDS